MVHYKNKDVPISKNDFFYLPMDTKHGFSNPREDTLKILVMGVSIPADSLVKPTPDLKIASANGVAFQGLSKSHGETSKYQLLMGNTRSIRDRLASANQISSLFVIDFAPGGTNIPHKHKDDEEIYFMLEGGGEMVAGETQEGKEVRYPAKEGDAFFYPPNTLVGFYSPAKPEAEHTRILAIRVKSPKQ
jgi:mannose-6-phosphate isomerase-like protein (cupin superfamily)